MRTAAMLAAAVLLLSACGGGKSHPKTTTTTTSTSTQVRTAPTPTGPQYVPSAHHKHRRRGYIYTDEVGENVLTASYNRVIQLFGTPASRRGHCIEYKIIGHAKGMWKFCFHGQKMISAAG